MDKQYVLFLGYTQVYLNSRDPKVYACVQVYLCSNVCINRICLNF